MVAWTITHCPGRFDARCGVRACTRCPRLYRPPPRCGTHVGIPLLFLSLRHATWPALLLDIDDCLAGVNVRMTALSTNGDTRPSTRAVQPPTPPSAVHESSQQLDLTLHYPDYAPGSSSPASRQRFISQLRRAMVGLGFFYLDASPLESARSELYRLTRCFFEETTAEQKEEIDQRKSRHFRGYSALGTEVTQNKKDNREQIDLASETPAVPSHCIPEGMEYLNLWGPK